MRMLSALRYSSTSASSRRSSMKTSQLLMRSSAAMDRLVRTASDRNSACCLRSSGTRPMPWRIASRGERIVDRLAVDEDAAGVERIGAEDRARHLGAAGADQPGDAEDLAAAHLERDVVEHDGVRVAARCRGASGPRPRARPRRRRGSSRWREERVDLAADHQPDDAVDVGLGDRAAADERPSRSTV